jgi:hypothetical protein
MAKTPLRPTKPPVEKVTFLLDQALKHDAQKLAIDLRVSFTELLTEGLRRELARRRKGGAS